MRKRKEIETGKSMACPYCSGPQDIFHYGRLCPKIKSIEYFKDGTIKKVEFRDEKV